MVTAWLINSMDSIIGKTFMYLKTARDVWEAIRETYSDLENQSQLYELNTHMWKMQQGNRDVTAYYNDMMAVWQELDLFEDEQWENSNDSARYKEKVERGRVFVFLAGLNKELDEVRGRILGKKPLPTIREVFSEVRREEARRQVMLKNNDEPKINSEGSALVARGTDSGGKQKPRCDYCRKSWHTRESCWMLHGKPKKKTGSDTKSGGDVRAFQANSTDPGQQSSSESLPFTKEQIEHLHKMFHSQSLEKSNLSCSLAQSGNSFIAALACTKFHGSWILDSGATDHMTGNSQLFSSYIPCAGNQKVKIANGSLATVAGKGTITISPSLVLKNVLHVPHLSYNLLSISKLTFDHNCQVIFQSSCCKFQDLTSGKMIGGAKMGGRLYFFNNGSTYGRQDLQTCFNSISVVNDSKIMLWHYRLGHPNFQYLKLLLPKLFMNKNPSVFRCESCELAKHHRAIFQSQPYKKSKPFTMIHSNVWGPSRVPTFSGKR
uniref:Uncharacterized protein n=1 Tax=Citrus limon TaxID=2708 RepID=A0A1S8ADA3_CITLI